MTSKEKRRPVTVRIAFDSEEFSEASEAIKIQDKYLEIYDKFLKKRMVLSEIKEEIREHKKKIKESFRNDGWTFKKCIEETKKIELEKSPEIKKIQKSMKRYEKKLRELVQTPNFWSNARIYWLDNWLAENRKREGHSPFLYF